MLSVPRMTLAAAMLLATMTAASAPCDAPPDPPIPSAPSKASRPLRRSSATPPGTTLTLEWVATQLIPSPELAFGESGAVFGLRWQIVPLLYSFGIDPRLSPFRVFVVEPLVRTSGSVELFVSPEYLAIDDEVSRRFGIVPALRDARFVSTLNVRFF